MEGRNKRMFETKRAAQTDRSERTGVVHSFTSHSKMKTSTEEEFLKKIIKDDSVIKKISLCKNF